MNLEIFKEGWLHKRGEHIKTWRARYFILKTNGYFLGFNSKPISQNEIDCPNNTFFIKDCQVMTSDKPKLNVFILKCQTNESTNIERFFAAYNSLEREEWIKSIEHVSKFLNGSFQIQKYKTSFEKLSLHDFEYLKILGKGTFGKVILCQQKQTNKIYAMKILKKNLILEKNKKNHTKTENIIMRTLKHPFLTSMICSFQTSDLLCLVMEYVNGGELFFHLSRERKFNENKSKFYCAEICYAIGYLHQNNVIYRDIKLENILLDSEGHIKLADFGLCKMNMNYESKTDTFCGTIEYLAPEIIMKDLNGKTSYTRAVDWWAVGVVLYEMLTGCLPFSCKTANSNEQNQKGLFEKILNEDLYIPFDITNESRNILFQFLEKDPSKRIGSSYRDFDEIKCHQFFSTINWNKLANREIKPPFKPLLESDTDTSYFDKEFTRENVQLTPPEDKMLSNINNSINYFDSFSYYGSKTSLQSRISQTSSVKSTDKFDTNFLLLNNDSSTLDIHRQKKLYYYPPNNNSNTFEEFLKQLNQNKNCLEDSSSLSLVQNAFPNIINSNKLFSASKSSFDSSNSIISIDLESESQNQFLITQLDKGLTCSTYRERNNSFEMLDNG